MGNILRTQMVEKSLMEIFPVLIFQTDFGGVLKRQLGELKYCFLPTAPIQIVWYIEIFLTV
jgi:hypothetical protein